MEIDEVKLDEMDVRRRGFEAREKAQQLLQAKEDQERQQGREVGRPCKSLLNALDNCNVLQLRAVKKVCDVMIAKHRKAPDRLECQQHVLKILCSAAVRNHRYQVEFRSCGKTCNHVPHGPYIYEYHYDGSIVRPRSLKGHFQWLPQKLRSQFRQVYTEAQTARKLAMTATPVPVKGGE